MQVFKNGFLEKVRFSLEILCRLVFTGCEYFMESLSRCDRSSFPEQGVTCHVLYTLQRCATFPTNILSLGAQPGVCPRSHIHEYEA